MNFSAEIKAVLFDLDGTLLPMEQDYFIKKYFKGLAEYGESIGIDPNKLIEGTIAGTKTMITNRGDKTNMEAFWETFFKYVGEVDETLPERVDGFYLGSFKNLREYTGENPLAVEMIKQAHNKSRKVVLATNPVFPMAAQLERISWLGLAESDFDLITSYENSKFCKPNPEYYHEICRKIGVAPENCLMIGNDESDDMKGASMAGINCFLVTDNRIMANNFMWQGERGSFEQALRLMEKL